MLQTKIQALGVPSWELVLGLSGNSTVTGATKQERAEILKLNFSISIIMSLYLFL